MPCADPKAAEVSLVITTDAIAQLSALCILYRHAPARQRRQAYDAMVRSIDALAAAAFAEGHAAALRAQTPASPVEGEGAVEALAESLDYFRPSDTSRESASIVLTAGKMRVHLAVIEAALRAAVHQELADASRTALASGEDRS